MGNLGEIRDEAIAKLHPFKDGKWQTVSKILKEIVAVLDTFDAEIIATTLPSWSIEG